MENLRERTREWLKDSGVVADDVLLDSLEYREDRLIYAIENEVHDADVLRWEIVCKKLKHDLSFEDAMKFVEVLYDEDIEVLDIEDMDWEKDYNSGFLEDVAEHVIRLEYKRCNLDIDEVRKKNKLCANEKEQQEFDNRKTSVTLYQDDFASEKIWERVCDCLEIEPCSYAVIMEGSKIREFDEQEYEEYREI